MKIVKPVFLIFFCCVLFQSYGQDSTIVDVKSEEPSSGNALFFTGLGLTIAGLPTTIVGILGINDLLLQNVKADSGGIVAVNGIPVNTLDETIEFAQYSKGIGVACIIFAVVFESVGIPLLVKGNKNRNVYKKWLEEHKVSMNVGITNSTTRLNICFRF